MVQSVLLMEQFAERLTGKLVVWFVCLENDLRTTWRRRCGATDRRLFGRPSARGGWEIADEHVGPVAVAVDRSQAGSGSCRICACPGPLADRAYAGCDYLIGRASAACSRVGAQLVW